MLPTLYDISLTRIDGSSARLADYRGKVLLVVNVASKCGLTPQYAALEALHREFGARGLSVMGFPCNDFAAQEPGSEAEIQTFCESSYSVSFPLFAKLNINSAPRHPLYAALIAARPEATASGDGRLATVLAKEGLMPSDPSDVMWNFEKFLIGRDGAVIGRFAPDLEPKHPLLVAAIESALAG